VRDDAFARQLDAYIRRLTPPAGLTDRMRGEFEKEGGEDTVAGSVATEAIRPDSFGCSGHEGNFSRKFRWHGKSTPN